MSRAQHKVYIVGTGVGDLEYLTIKAVSILKTADVVIYDSCIDEGCFLFCKSYVLRIKVKDTQHSIETMLQHSLSNKTVVRLISGSPFVFDKGYNEAQILLENQIEPVIISGVSSTTSVVESFMLPLNNPYYTLQGDNIDLFKKNIINYNKNIDIIILDGIKNIKRIIDIFIQKQYPLDTKISILSKGWMIESSIMESTFDIMIEQDENFFNSLLNLQPAIIYISSN